MMKFFNTACTCVAGDHYLIDLCATSVAFSPNGRLLASGGDDKAVRLWNIACRNLSGMSLRGQGINVTSVVFNPGGQKQASASGDMTVRLWDTDFAPTSPMPTNGWADSGRVM